MELNRWAGRAKQRSVLAGSTGKHVEGGDTLGLYAYCPHSLASLSLLRHNIELSWSPALVDSLTLNFDERYGYRSVIYAVERRVVNVLASAHERDLISSGCKVSLDLAEQPSHPGQQPPVVIREVIRDAPSASSSAEEGEGKKKKFFGIF